MAKKARKPTPMETTADVESLKPARAGKPSSLLDTRVIYCGDNLEQLAKLPDACVDLIYIDPPFNSNRNYEVFWGETKEKRSFEDRHASTQAYIDYMRPRCQQLARVLKKTGSFYYHCDWHASHYVKAMLDQLFSENLFQNEIVWRRHYSHNDPKRYGCVHDVIFYYVNGKQYTWNQQFVPHAVSYIESHYASMDGEGRRFQLVACSAPGDGPARRWNGKVMNPPQGRHWSWTQEGIDELEKKGRIVYTKNGMPRLKQYLDEMKGVPLQDVWEDIPPVNSQAEEALGYPTQKPLPLLERIINSSSNPNDIVLDAFCGCGTALVAAQNLGRQWIGIDISPTACRVMAKRLRDVCHLPTNEALWRSGRGVSLRELPYSPETLRKMPPFEFENWAVIALGGVPNKVQVGDMGIDGRIFPVGTKPSDEHSMFAGDWFPVQVKQSERVGRPDIDAFEAVMEREDRERGFVVAFSFSSDAERECAGFHKRTKRIIKLITVQEILDEQFVQKM